MPKVLIVTKISRNFGALLQACALKKTLERMGAEVSVLNLDQPHAVRSFQLLPKITGWNTCRQFLRELPLLKQKKQAIARSLQFRREYLNLTGRYPSYEVLAQNPPEADLFITGSDQVWNPKNSYDKAYYLLFGKPEALRASYAASIAVDRIPEALQEDFPRRVRNMDCISVRENSGKELLAQYGIEAQVHLDPTLLLEREDYEKLLIKPKLKEPYVLLYLVRMPKDPEQIVQRLHDLYPGRKVVYLIGETRAKRLGDIQISYAGPREFLGLIRFADAVVTTSFHGTVFSGVFGKEFAAVLPLEFGGRITNLLELADMESHMVSDASQLDRSVFQLKRNMMQAPRLKQMQAESLSYLHNLIETAEPKREKGSRECVIFGQS